MRSSIDDDDNNDAREWNQPVLCFCCQQLVRPAKMKAHITEEHSTNVSVCPYVYCGAKIPRGLLFGHWKDFHQKDACISSTSKDGKHVLLRSESERLVYDVIEGKEEKDVFMDIYEDDDDLGNGKKIRLKDRKRQPMQYYYPSTCTSSSSSRTVPMVLLRVLTFSSPSLSEEEEGGGFG